METASIIKVIRTTANRGLGQPEDPLREVEQYWTLKGQLILTNDPIHQSEDKEFFQRNQQALPIKAYIVMNEHTRAIEKVFYDRDRAAEMVNQEEFLQIVPIEVY